MGEIFGRVVPAETLTFTGERFTSAVTGEIELEHYHRYFVARELCRGYDVLDIACGEGYGSEFLAQTARSVVGVDIDETTITHARRSYSKPKFLVGDAKNIPLCDASVDRVVSFETLEHFYEQQRFLEEVKRVLRPAGVLLVSTPDRDLYTRPDQPSNPHHVKELSREEFHALLSDSFEFVRIFYQRAIMGSAILEANRSNTAGSSLTFERRGASLFELSEGLPRAPFMIAVAADTEISFPSTSLYLETGDVNGVYERLARFEEAERSFRNEEQRLHTELASAGQRADRFKEAEAAFHAEEFRLRSELARGEERANRFKEAEAAFHAEELRLRGELAQAAERENRLKEERAVLRTLEQRLREELTSKERMLRETITPLEERIQVLTNVLSKSSCVLRLRRTPRKYSGAR